MLDAQFSVKDGEALVDKIRKSGKTLNKIVITLAILIYFGLQPLVKAFLNAKVVATQQVVDYISATKDAKLALWDRKRRKMVRQPNLSFQQVLASTTWAVTARRLISSSQKATPPMFDPFG